MKLDTKNLPEIKHFVINMWGNQGGDNHCDIRVNNIPAYNWWFYTVTGQIPALKPWSNKKRERNVLSLNYRNIEPTVLKYDNKITEIYNTS